MSESSNKTKRHKHAQHSKTFPKMLRDGGSLASGWRIEAPKGSHWNTPSPNTTTAPVNDVGFQHKKNSEFISILSRYTWWKKMKRWVKVNRGSSLSFHVGSWHDTCLLNFFCKLRDNVGVINVIRTLPNGSVCFYGRLYNNIGKQL